MALRSLSTFDPQALVHNSGVILKRLRDRNESVVNAALITSSSIGSVSPLCSDCRITPTNLHQSNPAFSKLRQAVNGAISSIDPLMPKGPSTSLAILHSLQVLGCVSVDRPDTGCLMRLRLAWQKRMSRSHLTWSSRLSLRDIPVSQAASQVQWIANHAKQH